MAEWERDCPWRQGHVMPDEAVRDLGLTLPEYPDKTVVVLISHDCDLAQSPENEPEVEIIIGHTIDKLDGNSTHTKNTRRLHLTYTCDGDDLHVELLATQKYALDKQALTAYKPAQHSLSPDGHVVLQRWLGSRYCRAAFPDEFERRLKAVKLHERIAKIVSATGNSIVTVFFDVDSGQELAHSGEDDPYTLDIVLLYDTARDPEAARVAAEKAATAIGNELKSAFHTDKGWKSIELISCEAMSDEAITYKQSNFFKQWRLEHISLRTEPMQPLFVAHLSHQE